MKGVVNIENSFDWELWVDNEDDYRYTLTIVNLEGYILYINPMGLKHFEYGEDIIGTQMAPSAWVDPKQRQVWLDTIKKKAL